MAVSVHIPSEARLLTGDVSLVVLFALIEQAVLTGGVVGRYFRGVIPRAWTLVVVQSLRYL
jgi:hypothetical protein